MADRVLVDAWLAKADAVEAHHAAQNIGDAVKAVLFPTTPG